MWTLESGVAFVRRLQLVASYAGYEVALAGSVLTRGRSSKDLDVVLFPRSTSVVNLEGLRILLTSTGILRLAHDRDTVTARWRRIGSDDEKHVEVWVTAEGLRVDLFFLR